MKRADIGPGVPFIEALGYLFIGPVYLAGSITVVVGVV